MLCEYSHKNVKVLFKSVLVWLINAAFSRGLFLLAHTVFIAYNLGLLFNNDIVG